MGIHRDEEESDDAVKVETTNDRAVWLIGGILSSTQSLIAQSFIRVI